MEIPNVQLPRSNSQINATITICIYGKKNRLSFPLTLYIISNVSLILSIKFLSFSLFLVA